MGKRIAWAVIIIATAFGAGAVEVVDQAVQIEGPPTYFDVVTTNRWAQTFTSQLAGELAEVDLQIARNPNATADLVVDIRPVTSTGVPVESDDMVLAITSIPAALVPLSPYPKSPTVTQLTSPSTSA